MNELNVKIEYKDDMRRLVLQEISYEKLIQKIQEIYNIKCLKRYLISYKDDEDDYITIKTEEEFKMALKFLVNGILRLRVKKMEHPVKPKRVEKPKYYYPTTIEDINNTNEDSEPHNINSSAYPPHSTNPGYNMSQYPIYTPSYNPEYVGNLPNNNNNANNTTNNNTSNNSNNIISTPNNNNTNNNPPNNVTNNNNNVPNINTNNMMPNNMNTSNTNNSTPNNNNMNNFSTPNNTNNYFPSKNNNNNNNNDNFAYIHDDQHYKYHKHHHYKHDDQHNKYHEHHSKYHHPHHKHEDHHKPQDHYGYHQRPYNNTEHDPQRYEEDPPEYQDQDVKELKRYRHRFLKNKIKEYIKENRPLKEFIQQNRPFKAFREFLQEKPSHNNEKPYHHHDKPFHKDKPYREKKTLMAKFLSHVTIQPEEMIQRGSTFIKTWKMKNEGIVQWPEGCRLVFISKHGHNIASSNEYSVKALMPGEEIDISLDMTAPNYPCKYLAYWKMQDANGKKFGQRIWISIFVV